MAMVQFFFDNVFEWTEGVVIDDKTNRVQGFRRKDDFRDVIVPMQPTTRMTVGETFYDMAGAEVELLGVRLHVFLFGKLMGDTTGDGLRKPNSVATLFC